MSVALGAAPGPEICIDSRYDKKNNTEIILWKDVEQVFSHVKYVLNGQLLVSFMVDDDFEDLEPKRISYHPGVVLEVVTSESEKASAALPNAPTGGTSPPSSPLPASASVPQNANALPRKAVPLATINTVSDFVVFKEAVENDTREDSEEDEEEVPDLERVPLNDEPANARVARQQTVEATASEIWSEDDELDAEFALRYYLEHPETELGNSHFFQGDFVRYIIILANSKELKRLSVTTSALTVAAALDATVVDPKVLRPIFNMIESKDILIQEKASAVLSKLANIDGNPELIMNNGGLRCLLQMGISESSTLRRNFATIMVSLAKNEDNSRKIACDKNIMAALLRLVQLDDIEIQQGALKAISHLTEVVDARPRLVEAGVLLVLTRLLASNPIHVLHILTALINITEVAGTVEWFVQSAPRIIRTLKELLEKNCEELSSKILLEFMTQLASEETFQQEI
ncbi:hypothetical protein BGZ72_011040, partial [Mortierella alpina]